MKQKVLIVDDEKDICNLLSSILAGVGYETLCCHSLSEGKLRFVAYQPDVLFLDIHLPDGNGLDDVPVFRNLNPKIPVMIISAFDSAVEIRKAKTYQVNAFIRKPFNREQVIAGLTNIHSMQS
jgi:two-component system response regulator PilR (NtrC family)/two-component system KDP operon response regulator KdpE